MRLSFSTKALGAIAGVAMLGATMSEPASAFTLASPSIGGQFSATGHVDKVWWRGGWGWRGGGWGWRGGGWGWRGGWGYRPWGWGGPFVAGAVVGGAVAAAPYYYGGGCWRRVWGPYGWSWARVC